MKIDTLCLMLALVALGSVFHSMDEHRRHEQTQHELQELRHWLETRERAWQDCHVVGNGTAEPEQP